jgi:hypothetical protein
MRLVKFTNNKLKKIVNVYQLNYINGTSPGFGDFLRGCFCFNQIANLLGLEFDLDVSNHPMAKYLENSYHVEGIDYNNIEISYEHNLENSNLKDNINYVFLNNIILWLNKQDIEILPFFGNSFPTFNNHKQETKNLINSKIQPNKLMRNYIDETLSELGLEKKNYAVIHIRTGDKYFLNGEKMSLQFIKKIKTILTTSMVPGRRYLIISDSNYLKSKLKGMTNCYILIRKISHLGGSQEHKDSQEFNGLINTMIDYYLMTYSNTIISMSVYCYGSGFSRYCAILNNIPYNFFFIKE